MSVVRIIDIAHVRFAAPDLAAMGTFLGEFGLANALHDDGRLYARGRDGWPFLHVTEPGEPRFIGLGLRVESVAELERLAAADGAAVEDLAAPGGGRVVRLTDPDGYQVDVVAGQARSAAEPADPSSLNTALRRTRAGRLPVRRPTPSRVRRIGHCGLGVTDLRRSEDWYKQRFGFLTSDEVEMAPGERTGLFLRCDRGALPVDHHTIVFAQFPRRPRFLHAAFEVDDIEELMLGHAYLKARERRHVWGVGRHILGSQIFDYWQDPWGHELEHWTDGDRLTASDPPGHATFAESVLSQWGSSHPALSAPRKERS